jgi:hypothetical protein
VRLLKVYTESMSTTIPIHDGSTDPPDEPDELNEHVQDPGDPDGIIAAEQRQHWQENHPALQPAPGAAYRPKKLWPKIVIVVVVLVAAAFGSYWFGNHQASKKQAAKTSSSSTTNHQANQAQNQQTQAATETKHYDSSTYTLGFDYPKTWTVSDTSARLTVTSPTTQLTTATGSKVNWRVVVAIQNPVSSIAGFPASGAVASLASSHLTYKQPSSVQRAQTYLSYLGFRMTSGLDALYVTGDNGYQQGQSVPMSDIVKGNPLISVMFDACSDENCTSPKTTTISTSSWQSSAASKDVTNLIESIVLQG